MNLLGSGEDLGSSLDDEGLSLDQVYMPLSP